MKLRITDTYEDLDGATKQRASMEDALTMHKRLFTRIMLAMGEDRANVVVIPAINAYNTGQYDEALTRFDEALRACPATQPDLAPHVEICRRVVGTRLGAEDHVYLAKTRDWNSMFPVRRWLIKLIASDMEPDFRLRCKYCGHYTPYIDPNEGLAYFGTNNCHKCGRGYPIPDFVWDSVEGQGYIYYRGSVSSEEPFYREFESRFEVNPKVRVKEGRWTKVFAEDG